MPAKHLLLGGENASSAEIEKEPLGLTMKRSMGHHDPCDFTEEISTWICFDQRISKASLHSTMIRNPGAQNGTIPGWKQTLKTLAWLSSHSDGDSYSQSKPIATHTSRMKSTMLYACFNDVRPQHGLVRKVPCCFAYILAPRSSPS